MVWRTCCDRCLASILADGINCSQCEVGQKGIEMANIGVPVDPVEGISSNCGRFHVEAAGLIASRLAPTGNCGVCWTWEKRQSPHKAGFGVRVGGRCWSPAYKVYQDSHRTVLCSSASHGIRAGSQRGDLSNRVPFGTRPTCPCHPLAHQSASSPTT